jgi:hypothetical protein
MHKFNRHVAAVNARLDVLVKNIACEREPYTSNKTIRRKSNVEIENMSNVFCAFMTQHQRNFQIEHNKFSV